MSLREGLLTASSHLVFSSEPLQETAGVADDGEALKKIAKLTPSFLAGTRGAQGTIWLDEQQNLQQTPAFPVHTVDTLGAGDVFHGAFALAITEKQEHARGAAVRLRRRSPEMHPLRRRLCRPATC